MNESIVRKLLLLAVLSMSAMVWVGCDRQPETDEGPGAEQGTDIEWIPEREIDFSVPMARADMLLVYPEVQYDVWFAPFKEASPVPRMMFESVEVVDVLCQQEHCRVRVRAEDANPGGERLAFGAHARPFYFMREWGREPAELEPPSGERWGRDVDLQALRDFRFRQSARSDGKPSVDPRTRACRYDLTDRSSEAVLDEKTVGFLLSEFHPSTSIGRARWVDLYAAGDDGKPSELVLKRVGVGGRDEQVKLNLTIFEAKLVFELLSRGRLIAMPNEEKQTVRRSKPKYRDLPHQKFGESGREYIARARSMSKLPRIGDLTAEELLEGWDWVRPDLDDNGVGLATTVSSHSFREPSERRRLVRAVVHVENPDEVTDLELRLFIGDSQDKSGEVARQFDVLGYADQTGRYRAYRSGDDIRIFRDQKTRGAGTQVGIDANYGIVSLGAAEATTFVVLFDVDPGPETPTDAELSLKYTRNASKVVVREPIELEEATPFADSSLEHRFAALVAVVGDVLYGSLDTYDLNLPPVNEFVTEAETKKLQPARQEFLRTAQWVITRLGCVELP